MVQRVELGGDAVLILEPLVEQERRVELQFEMITAQVLDVILDHDLNGFTWRSRDAIERLCQFLLDPKWTPSCPRL